MLLNDHIFSPIGYVQAASHHRNHHTPPTSDHVNSNSNIKHVNPLPHSILVCCAWNSQFTNGVLTYKISGGNTGERQAVNSAANTWMQSLKGLRLIQVSGKSSSNIIVGFQSRGAAASSSGVGSVSRYGDTVGQTSTYFDSSGYIDHVLVTLATSAFGKSFPSPQIKQIAMHEIGHTLGLGHANFKGDLMSPVINQESGSISKCDISGVLDANKWKLVGSGVTLTPIHPLQDHVNC
jgi:hypothetical protein